MGYYSNYFIKSVIRRIVNILINKKTLKFLTFVIILTIILFKIFNNTVVYGASVVEDSTYFDAVQADTLQIDIAQKDILSRVRNLYDTHKEELDLMISRINTGNYDILTYYGNADGSSYNNTSVNSKNVVRLVLVPVNSSKSIASWSNWSANGNIVVNSISVSSRGGFSYNFYYDQSLSIDNLASGFVVYYPNFLINYRNGDFIDGLYNLLDISDDLITDTIIDSTNNIIDNQNQNTNTIVENQDKNTQEVLNTVTDSTINKDVVNTLPSNDDYIDDKTGEFLDGVFTRLMTAFTNPTIENISVTVPFTNKQFSISRELIYGENDVYLHSWVKSIINLFWKFIVSLYILQDITKIIDNLRNGRFDAVESTNIKGGML